MELGCALGAAEEVALTPVAGELLQFEQLACRFDTFGRDGTGGVVVHAVASAGG
jgi:hypothetical protein